MPSPSCPTNPVAFIPDHVRVLPIENTHSNSAQLTDALIQIQIMFTYFASLRD